MEERNRIWFWFSYLHQISIHKINCLIEQFLDKPEEIFTMTDHEVDRMEGFSMREKKLFCEARDKRKEIMEEYRKLSKLGIRFISFEDQEYPKQLKRLADYPVGLFVKGKLPKQNIPCVSIVGARTCSSYGKDCAVYFGEILSEAGISVISGMAYGVDMAAQQAALPKKGGSFAVFAGGVDICYPKNGYGLYQDLIKKGGIISEMPIQTPSKPYLFTRRNRIISGLSDAVIVIEAREKSGSLITANYAAEQGKLVYAVPGRIDSGLSKGCHQLIRQGAILLDDPKELLEDLNMIMEKEIGKEFFAQMNGLNIQEKDIYGYLGSEPIHVEQLLFATGYPAGNLMQALLQLEIKGYALQEPKNYYRKTKLIPPKITKERDK